MLNKYPSMIENRLNEIAKKRQCDYGVLIDAMRYSLSAGGKRIRPSLLLEFCRVCGGDVDSALNFACAIEMIHTYSLIHDDLPCMDNDDMRRGKPSCHIAFGEANALLAGDALLTEAFNIALSTDNISHERVVCAAKVLAEFAGVNGMIGGQVIDLMFEKCEPQISSVLEMYRLKTGALLAASAKIGCILAGADKDKIESAEKFAFNIGLAFQIRDDVLDITSTTEQLGKPIGSDSQSNKSTYVSFVGIETAQEDVKKYTDSALIELKSFGDESKYLKEFALNLVNRKN